jgi:O-antigen ligase
MKPNLLTVLVILGVLLIPIDSVMPFSGIRITLAEIFFSLAFFVWLRMWDRKLESVRGERYLYLSLIMFLVICAVSVFVAQNKFLALRETIQFSWLWGMFFFFLILFYEHNMSELIWKIFVVTAVASSIFGLYQYFVFREPISELIADTRFRATGFYDQPNALGSFLAASLLLMSGLFLLEKAHSASSSAVATTSRQKVIFYCICIAISSAGVTATFSRGSWIALAAGLILLFLMNRKQYRDFLPLVAAYALGAVFVFTDASFQPKDKLIEAHRWVEEASGLRSFSDKQRRLLLDAAFQMFVDNPVIGVGIGNFHQRLIEYTPPEKMGLLQQDYDPVRQRFFINPGKKLDVEIVHNFPLQIAAETGFLGLFFFLSFLIVFFYTNVKRLNIISDGRKYIIRSTSLSAAITIFVAGLFGWPFSHGVQEILILMMAFSVTNKMNLS